MSLATLRRNLTLRHRSATLGAAALLATTFVGVPAVAASPTTYHVDCTGSDQASGTSPGTAWRTVDKTRQAQLDPGDSLLFKRGCTWDEGQRLFAEWEGTAAAPITIGAYGSGARPKLMNGRIDTVHVTGSYLIVRDLWVDNEPDSFATCATSRNGIRRTPVGSYYGINLTRGAHHIEVRDSRVQHSTVGLHISKTAGRYNSIIGNEFVDNDVMQGPFGVDLGAWGVLVRGNDNEIAHNFFSRNVARCGDGVNPFIDSNSVEIYEGSRNSIHHNRAIGDRVFSEMGSSSKVKARDNYYGFNVAVSDIAGARFLTTRGADDERYGPVLGTVLEHNTVIYTGDESEAVVCAKGCRSSVLVAQNNIFQTAGKAFFVDGSSTMTGNLLSSSTGDGSVIIQDAGGRRMLDEGTSNSRFTVADPQFGGTHAWMLTAASPAIDTAEGAARFTYDIDQLDVSGDGRDIGAFEFQGSSSTTTTTTLPEITTTTTTVPSADTPPSNTNPTTTTTTTIPTASGVPTILETTVDGTSITIGWTGGQVDTLYRIRYRIGVNEWSSRYRTSDEQYRLTGLKLNARYHIQVGARIDGKWPNLWDSTFVST